MPNESIFASCLLSFPVPSPHRVFGPSRCESPTDIENAPYRREIEVKLFACCLGTDVANTDDLMRVGEMLLAGIMLAHYVTEPQALAQGSMGSKRIVNLHSARHGSKTLLLLNLNNSSHGHRQSGRHFLTRTKILKRHTDITAGYCRIGFDNLSNCNSLLVIEMLGFSIRRMTTSLCMLPARNFKDNVYNGARDAELDWTAASVLEQTIVRLDVDQATFTGVRMTKNAQSNSLERNPSRRPFDKS
jgi:hypothetical protein